LAREPQTAAVPRPRRAALTGGIACGKSLFARHLNACGVETLDADDVVHGLVPEAERRRLARIVFRDPAARKALEAKLHPVVKARLLEFLAAADAKPRLVIVPLLFEAGWEKDFDFIACLTSTRENQIARMMERRGYTRAEAEGRLAAQMPVAEKAARSDVVIENDGPEETLAAAAVDLARRFLPSAMSEGIAIF